MGKSENQIKQDILTWMRYKGHDVWVANTGRLKGKYKIGKPGLPDIIGYHKDTGAFIGIEVKHAKGTPTPEQVCFIENLKRTGGIACVAWSLAEVVTVLGDYEGG